MAYFINAIFHTEAYCICENECVNPAQLIFCFADWCFECFELSLILVGYKKHSECQGSLGAIRISFL